MRKTLRPYKVPNVCKIPVLSKDKAKARVQIAKDVQGLSRMAGISIERGKYVNLMLPDLESVGTDARQVLKDFLKNGNNFYGCHVCGKGALLIASVLRFNKKELSEIGGTTSYYGGAGIDAGNDDCIIGLDPFFSERALDEIEAAFEGWTNGETFELGDRGSKARTDYDESNKIARRWIKKYKDVTKRLDAIMQNIIRNKGDFKFSEIEPPVRKTGVYRPKKATRKKTTRKPSRKTR